MREKKTSGSAGLRLIDLLLIIITAAAVCAALICLGRVKLLEENLETAENELALQSARLNDYETAEKERETLPPPAVTEQETFTEEIKEQSAEEALYSEMKDLIKRDIPDFTPEPYEESDYAGYLWESIYAINCESMGRIFNYGAIAAEYISPEGGREERIEVMSRIKAISDEICAVAVTEKDKADAIGLWVAKNVYYDMDAFNSGVTAEVISVENTLDKKRTTCAGYSNMFSALCQAQGIVTLNLRGGAREVEEQTLENAPRNHEWNAAYCDGKWLFYDTTWTSENMYENGQYTFSEKLNEMFLGTDFKEMSLFRRLDIAEYRNFYLALFPDT